MDFMIDLETTGTRPGCMIPSIGVVAFDAARRLTLDEFYAPISLESQQAIGLKIDAGTFRWWLRQSDEARAAISGDGAPDIQEVFSELSEFFRRNAAMNREAGIWGNGASFDLPILIAAYDACRLPVPWYTFGDRCYRTEKNRRPEVKMQRIGTHHNALDDARSQTEHLFRIWERDEEDRLLLQTLDQDDN